MRSFLLLAPVAAILLLMFAHSATAADPVPQWLWTNKEPKENESAFFRKAIELDAAPKSATFYGACDNVMTLFVNGEQVTQHSAWDAATRENLTKRLKAGKNVIAIRASNQGGPAAFIAQINIERADGTKLVIVTDESWKAASEARGNFRTERYDDSAWGKPHSFGKLGIAPWGDIALTSATASGSAATPVEAIQTLPGFKVELLYSVPKESEGSWVNMTSDNKGRLIVSDQYGALYRVMPGQDAETTQVEQLAVPLGEAQGLLYAFDALYVVVNRGQSYESGLYRLTDTNGDDQFDKVEQLKKINGGGEHGPHAVKLGPDGKLYVIAGNHTQTPDGLDPASPHRNWAEDLLLPRNPDGNGHATGVMAPGGWVCRTDKDGRYWEILCAGFRNEFDIDFNTDGELFTYDADMEWDTGAPWYRPTRVNHCVSAGEYGWRYGTGKWPDYSADSLGAVVDIGLGSPTGIVFGTGAKVPAKYQQALYINDWTYGKIYAVHMTPSGASYTGTFEAFITGRPLPVTDVVVHTDGQLYFTIGGRRTQSGLYRVTYVGDESTAPVQPVEDESSPAFLARALRHKLEAFHGTSDPAAVEAAWPHLNSSDRNIRYAARVAVEHQDPKLWAEKALADKRPTAVIQLMIALARAGDKSLQPRIVEKLNSLPYERMTEDQLTAAARAYGLCFIRMGQPSEALAKSVIDRVKGLFPNDSEPVSREFCTLLVYLRWPGVIAPAMEKLATGQTQQDQMYYEFVLRNVAELMSHEQLVAYFSWMNLAQSSYKGGNSFVKFVQQIRNDATARLDEKQKQALKDVIEGKQSVEVVKLETTRQFIHNWQMEDLLPLVDQVESGRSFEKGRAAYEAAQCYKCHRFAGEGGSTGPDITGVGSRFNTVYLLESLIVPSKAISDQYLGSVIRTLDGEIITGRVIEESEKELKVRTDPFARELLTIAKDNIDAHQQSRVSEMPQGLINTLTKEEILDLVAYMRSAGNAQDKAFAPAGK
ncbi:MAG TPA: c-type cytochrome [Pirellulaceae bacterium]|nr:c-type cytochrome [Pirellulaceae bacterium]